MEEVFGLFFNSVGEFISLPLFLIPVGIFVVGAAIGLVKRIL